MIRSPLLAGLVLAGPVLATACAPPPQPADDRPLVVVSIFPVADLLQRMAGDAVRVEVLLPPRAAPSTWEAAPSQVRTLASARGYVSVGAGLDDWTAGLGSVGKDVHTLRLTDGMALHAADHAHGHGGGEDVDGADGDGQGGDPHIWLDPVLVRDELLPRIEAFLAMLVPSEAGGFEARAAALSDSLTALDASIRTTLAPATVRGFVATHGAWTYFAERYGLEPLGSVYERPGHEPSALGLARLVRSARQAGLTAILAEPQLASTAAEALAREVGATVEVVDPLGGRGLIGRETYMDMMRFNAEAFARAAGVR